MGFPTFKIINPGPYTTIQKLPKQTNAGKGIPTSGAFDCFALKMGNLILKNPLDTSGIEITGEGGELQVIRETAIAVTGGVFNLKVNDKQIQQWCTVNLSKGDTISIGASESGWRCYICVSGGVRTQHKPKVKSILAGERVNEPLARPLRKGDVLTTETPFASLSKLTGRRVRENLLPIFGGEYEFRILPGPQFDQLKDESKEVFLNSSYRASIHSDRECYRFEGPQLLFKLQNDRAIGESGTQVVENSGGLIQVIFGGEVVCTGPDFASADDRVEIARLVTPDIGRIAQLKPKDHIRFKVVSAVEARSIFAQSISLICEENILS